MKRRINMTKVCWASSVLLMIFLTGCQSSPAAQDKTTGRQIDRTLEQASKEAKDAVPSAVSQALLPPLEINLPKGAKAPIEPKFDLSVSNAPARNVFIGLVEGTRYSVVVAPEVSGRISMDLKNVTVPESIDAIRRVYGYGYSRDKDRFYITGRGIQTRLYPVNYLNFKRTGQSETTVTSAQLTSTNGTSGDSSSTSSGGGTAVTSTPTIKVSTQTETDFWANLQRTLKAIVGTKLGRNVIVNPQTNLVIVTATPAEFRVVEEFLGKAHDTVNRQVVLEAKIVEVSLLDRYQTGVNWSALASAQGTNFTAGQVGGGTVFDAGVSGTAGNTGNIDPTTGIFTAISGTDATAFGGVFSLAVQSGNFAAFIEALKTQGEVQVLSSPRVSTVNNQKAVIKVGGDEFFVTGIRQSTVASGGATTTTPEIELTPFFSGIALDVTPQINKQGNIILHIHPSVSDVEEKTKNIVVSGENFSLPLAVSSIQESDNIVRAKSGQVIVIGGLMKEATADDKASVPVLGDIPLAGKLFRHKKLVRIKKELIILLKPTVVEVGQSWAEMINDSHSNVKRIRKEFK